MAIEIIPDKVCKKCGKCKFYVSIQLIKGKEYLKKQCITCSKFAHSIYYIKNKEFILTIVKKYSKTEKGKQVNKEGSKKYSRNNSDKINEYQRNQTKIISKNTIKRNLLTKYGLKFKDAILSEQDLQIYRESLQFKRQLYGKKETTN